VHTTSTEARAAPTFGALDTASSFVVPTTGAAVVCVEVFPAGAEVVAAEPEPASLASDTGVTFAAASLELLVEGAVTTSLELPAAGAVTTSLELPAAGAVTTSLELLVEGAVTTTLVVLETALVAVSLAGTVTLVAVVLAVVVSVVFCAATEEESRATKQNTTCASCMVTEVVDQLLKSPSRRCGG